jgi:hypothetical protein
VSAPSPGRDDWLRFFLDRVARGDSDTDALAETRAEFGLTAGQARGLLTYVGQVRRIAGAVAQLGPAQQIRAALGGLRPPSGIITIPVTVRWTDAHGHQRERTILLPTPVTELAGDLAGAALQVMMASLHGWVYDASDVDMDIGGIALPGVP